MLNNLIEKYGSILLESLGETADMIFFSAIFSFVLGLLVAIILFSTRPKGIYENKIIYFIFSSFVNTIRSVPFILFIIILIPFNRFIVGTGFGANASKVPLTLIGLATFARLAEQSFLDVKNETYETSYMLGASKISYFKDFLFKESRSNIVLNFTSTLVSLLSYSTVMGTIGGGGLGDLAIREGFANFKYDLMWIIIIVMIILVQVTQAVGNLIARKIDKR
ncbi:ABC-type metal ion transporter, permease component [Alteracholeplasma palmae J233]|uniref:ABC-type metal ion transporter, permease component n=1 Tax=Alteracholeplasma palmae (strain ATCC 49389 / J233) TaxID=1318466 RepID=U4KPF9_ALTPJ|nr:ABC transporter permease subunit [Alteracholeplasma palmae]CCV64125.1 ABC-type metal ion transporter, permease component [Alteracholeplasma palmae J233]